MGKKKWVCCGKEFAGVAKITEHLESVHGANRPKCRVSGLVGLYDTELPPVIVEATCSATAKLEAAFRVGGYWTEDTVAERATEEEESDGTQT